MKRIKLVILTLSFVVLLCPYISDKAFASTNGHTREEATAWAIQRGNERWGRDLDGNGLWCYDLIHYYYDYLGVPRATGVDAWNIDSRITGPGWYKDNTPRNGAVVVFDRYTKTSINGASTGKYGHVGIVTSVHGDQFDYVSTAQNKAAFFTTCYTSYAKCFIHPDFPASTAYLDLNGRFEGNFASDISSWGTADVYINGAKVADNVSDYYAAHPLGASYEIKDIQARPGYKYDGIHAGAISGQIAAGNSFAELRFVRAQYTVTFNANGGTSGTSSKTVSYGLNYGELPAPTRTGYSFQGWYTESAAGNQVTASTKVSKTADHTLYAHWKGNAYNVTFNANGGTTKTSSKNVIYGDPYGTLPSGTKDGYTLIGWYTEASGGTRVIETKKVSTASNHTLYAHWGVEVQATGGNLYLDLTTGNVAYCDADVTSVTIPASAKNVAITGIDAGAFQNCKSLKTVKIPCSIKTIGASAFSGCTALESISIPEDVQEIPSFCFSNCTNLKTIYLPENLQQFSSFAFGLVPVGFGNNAMDIYYAGSEDQWKQINPTGALTGGLMRNAWNLHYGLTDNHVVHKYDSGKITKQPTEANEGTRTYTCVGCGKTKTEAVPKLTPKPSQSPTPTSTPKPSASEAPTPSTEPNPASSPKPSTSTVPEPAQPVTPGNSEKPAESVRPQPSATVAPVSKTVFADVPTTGKWYSEAVYYCADKGYVAGMGNNLYKPNETVTRATIAQILYAVEGKPSVSTSNVFMDVPNGKWFTSGVNWAASKGVVAGYGKGKFGPNDPITRQQMMTILYQYSKLKGYDLSDNADLNRFQDRGLITAYAVTPIKWAVSHNILSGTKNGIEPKGKATRAQIAVILQAYDDNIRTK